MQLSIAVRCAILTGSVFSVSARLRAYEDPFAISMQQDTSLSDYKLAEALRLPVDFTFSLFPTLRNLPDGTRIPALSFNMQLR